ncbi:hypothetical protein MKW98_032344 [Papaver atlanticum]|uniref:RING-type domain-containing protein n=1 Tax=Papaver atlanticum TaxID=357466 RepID=A0AAD4XCN3_9MAGN|nr:hypothetical protein MKW98_032344 [Papaver atlanticum]
MNQRNPTRDFFKCEICVEIFPMERKFKSMEIYGCSHPYCTDCVAKYIQTTFLEYNISKIKYPSGDCNVVLDAPLCQSILPKNVFENWCRLLCEYAVLWDSSKGGFAHGRSYCPYRECSELVLNECAIGSPFNNAPKVTKSNCPNCKKLFCFNCMVPWKEYHRCIRRSGTAVADIDSNDVSFMGIVKHMKWIRCPSCHHYVELSSGCSRVTCRCKRTFCHNCGSNSCVCWPRNVDCFSISGAIGCLIVVW